MPAYDDDTTAHWYETVLVALLLMVVIPFVLILWLLEVLGLIDEAQECKTPWDDIMRSGHE